MRIFMTGANGTVGSALLSFLLERRHEVTCLIRPRDCKSGQERLEKIVGELPVNCTVVEGDITNSDCGISYDVLTKLKRSKFDVMLHCAASIKMDPKRTPEVMATNMNGTKNAVVLTKTLSIGKIHHISTAYVENGGSNIYEVSKAKAEEVIGTSGIPFTTSRISIVIGDSQTGRISRFDGYYGFLFAFWMIAREVRNLGGLCNKSRIKIPTVVEVTDSATLNLIPLDWVVRMLTLITEKRAINGVLRVTHSKPISAKKAIGVGLDILGINSVRLESPVRDIPQSVEQKIISKIVRIFSPYITRQAEFCNDNLVEFLGGDYQNPPEITKELLQKILLYAVEQEFGRPLPTIARVVNAKEINSTLSE